MARLVGVFGGTFDPPHLGHLALAGEGREALRLGKVLWVVTGDPPHKPDIPRSPLETRLRMVQSAIEGRPEFEISRADIDRPPPHYAVGTIAWLRERMPGARFAYLIGSDSLRDLPTWHEPSRLVATCQILGVMRRPGAEVDVGSLESSIPGLSAKVRFFDAPLVAISGRDIRERVRRGEPYRLLVPAAVADIIQEERLYL